MTILKSRVNTIEFGLFSRYKTVPKLYEYPPQRPSLSSLPHVHTSSFRVAACKKKHLKILIKTSLSKLNSEFKLDRTLHSLQACQTAYNNKSCERAEVIDFWSLEFAYYR